MNWDEYNILFHKLNLNRVAFKEVKDCSEEILTLVNAALAAERIVIIEECARFANDYVADSFGVHYSVGDEIKKHFGIEDDLNNVRWKANYRYGKKGEEHMTLAWYDPTTNRVSTDKDDPWFTPLGQLWPLDVKREWVGLTDDEMNQCSYDSESFMIEREVAMRAVEAKLKEKNT